MLQNTYQLLLINKIRKFKVVEFLLPLLFGNYSEVLNLFDY